MNHKHTPNSILILIVTGLLVACSNKQAAEPAAAEPGDSDVVTVKPGAVALAGIEVKTLQAQSVPRWLSAPGEVKSNGYRSAQVTTRVAAQVVQRHAKLGDHVKRGQALATLSSVEVAEAQGEAQLKDGEWARVQELGEAVVGARRYNEARIAAEQAQAKLVAYGLAVNSAPEPLGQFTLVAPREGTVLRDNFMEGERIEPGHELFYIADESALWVEANLSPLEAGKVVEGGKARVKAEAQWLDGKVIQKHHLLDEHTRTIPVRIEINAPDDLLHTGEFVDCRIEVGHIDNALVVANDALYQGSDGQWAVFVQENAAQYRRVKVNIIDDLGDSKHIDGVSPGVALVEKGAFLLNSELSKGSFGEEE